MLKCSSCQAFLCVSLQLTFDFNKCTYAGVWWVLGVGCRVWGGVCALCVKMTPIVLFWVVLGVWCLSK